jgi:molybdenum cofactor guanylyltransferase
MPAPLYGLVLAGGFSSRLGRDKGLLCWNGYPQRQYLLDLIDAIGIPAYLSCRVEQTTSVRVPDQVILDTTSPVGPAGGILSAWERYPDVAWLVVACDMPLIDRELLAYIIQHRDPAVAVTSMASPASGEAEPLLAIWEPGARPMLEASVRNGNFRLRGVLSKLPLTLLPAPWPERLRNINTVEDMKELTAQIGIDWHNL